MRKLISSSVRKYTNWIVSRKSAISWSPLLKQRKQLMALIHRIIGPSVLGKKSRSLSGAAISFSKTVRRLYRGGGTTGVVLYLKKCSLLLMQAIGSTEAKPPCINVPPRVAITRTGIPRIIPVAHRKMIRQGNTSIIQLWLTFFAFHRVLTIKGPWKIDSIYSPYVRKEIAERVYGFRHVGLSEVTHGYPVGFKHYIPGFIDRLKLLDGLKVIPRPIWDFKPLLISSLGPNTSSGYASMATCPMDALAWAQSPLFPLLERFCELTGMTVLIDHIKRLSYMATPLDVAPQDIEISFKEPIDPKTGRKRRYTRETDPKELIFTPMTYLTPFIRWAPNLLSCKVEALGRLAFKKEKSGKVRIFAMVDYWTQCLLKPLHTCLFDILKHIPQDATFDQQGSVESFARQLGPKARVYSYDLSSATDRLPIVLQVEVLSAVLGNAELAVLWAMLLTCRAYFVSRKKQGDTTPKWGVHKVHPAILDYPLAQKLYPDYCNTLKEAKYELYTCNSRVYYSVGQPMGALTSWAMLALTHHFIVQLAFMRAYPGNHAWFRDYRVLGDDVVIADELVARYYVAYMRLLGVPLNKSKGLVSNNGSFEFAKTLWYKTQEVSPHSWADMRLGISSLSGLLLLFNKKRRRVSFSLNVLARAFGFGPNVASRVYRDYKSLLKTHPRLVFFLLTVSFPDTTPMSYKGFGDWVRSKRVSTITDVYPQEDLLSFLGDFQTRYYMNAHLQLRLPFHVESFLHCYHPRVGATATDVLSQLEGQLNEKFMKANQDALDEIKELEMDYMFRDKREPIVEMLNSVYEKFTVISAALDGYPKWITPRVEKDFPKHVNVLSSWIRYRLRTLGK